MAAQTLKGKIALVTGASRGVGKGVALGLGEAGATVYITGRTEVDEHVTGWPGTLQQTVEDVEALGGRCIPIRCDHRSDEQVAKVFQQIIQEQGWLDILVNNVWGGYEAMFENGQYTWPLPFWQQPVWRWDAMFQAGVRAHYVASIHAAGLMTAQRSGLIANISFWAGQKYMGNAAYGVAKAADDKMAVYMAHELREYNVAAVSIYPGLVRTEGVMAAAENFDLSNSESPQFTGRGVAALAADPQVMSKSGKVLVAAQLALEYGFTDIDGKQPRSLTLEEV
jgi:NAD(P)-dependent dehydrogenase (short-subunit alcohol dehydrogenase family)